MLTRFTVVASAVVVIGYIILCVILAFSVKFQLSNFNIHGSEPERFWFPAMNSSGVISQDGGIEVDLGGYYDPSTNSTTTFAYWLYGDTMLGYFDPPNDPVWNGWATNTAMLVSLSSLANGTQLSLTAEYTVGKDGRATEVVPFDGEIWPTASFTYDGMVYTFFEAPTPSSDFYAASYGLAYAPVSFSSEIYFQWAINTTSAIKYSPSHTLVVGDYVYVYIIFMETVSIGIKVGRLPLTIFSQNATFDGYNNGALPYQWWSGIGDGFDSDFDNSPCMHFGSFVQFSLFYNKYLGSYVLIHANGFPEANKVFMYTSPTPWGPFSKPFEVYDTKQAHFIYCFYFHSSLDSSGIDSNIIATRSSLRAYSLQPRLLTKSPVRSKILNCGALCLPPLYLPQETLH